MVEYPIDTLDLTFHALSNATRRAILGQLATRESATVLEIAEQFEISLNGVSKHLKVLEKAGLITRQVEGRTHHCAIVVEPLREAELWIVHNRRFWEERLDALEAFLQRQREGGNAPPGAQ